VLVCFGWWVVDWDKRFSLILNFSFFNLVVVECCGPSVCCRV